MYTVRQTEEFVAWLDDLKDKRAQVASLPGCGRLNKSSQKRDIRRALKLAAELGDDL